MVIIGVGNGGWVVFSTWRGSGGLIARVRFAVCEDGRLEPVEIHLDVDPEGGLRGDGPGRLTGELLRTLPLSHMEIWANGGPEREQLIQEIENAGPRLERETERWREKVASDQVQLNPETMKRLRRGALKLQVPTSLKKPDAFYQRIADLYTALARSGSRKPAQEIADANGIEVSKVHRWIKEARRREGVVVAPGRRGKAG